MKFQKIILIIVALIATNLSAFEPFTLSFTDRAADNKPNANKTIDVKLTLVNRYTGVALGSPSPTYQHTATAVKTNAYGMFSVVFEPVAWKSANFETDIFQNGYNNYALRIETKAHTGGASYKQIGVLAIGNLINNTVVTEAISGPAKSDFKITFNNGAVVDIPAEGASVDVPFAVAGFTPETIVKAIPSEGYSISITAYDKATGIGTAKLTRKAGSTLLAAIEATLIADNGNGKSTLASASFNAYYGLSSGLAESTTGYEANRAKPAWIITDQGEIDGTNPIKTALQAIYNNDNTARRQLELPNATGIGSSAFLGCRGLTSVSLPVATSIEQEAFMNCSALTSVSLPAATTIGVGAFRSCSGLTSISLPAAKTIGNYVFYNCTSLTSVSLPEATTIGGAAFYGCSKLSSASLPEATTIGDRAFYGCSKLSSASLPEATTIGNEAFRDCIGLSSVTLPVANSIGAGAFRDCIGLSSVTLPVANSIGEMAFLNCAGLTSVSFRTEITIWGTNVFSGATITSNIALTLNAGQSGISGNTFQGYTFKSITTVPTP